MCVDYVQLLESEQYRQHEAWLEDIEDGICPRCGADLIELDDTLSCTRGDYSITNTEGIHPEIEEKFEEIPF